MEILKNVTLEEVESSDTTTCYYSANTIWWTDDPKDLQPGPVPLDVFGSPLFMGPKKDFIKSAKSKPEHHGENGLTTFMASHHKNMKPEPGEPRARFKDFKELDLKVSLKKVMDPDFQLERR